MEQSQNWGSPRERLQHKNHQDTQQPTAGGIFTRARWWNITSFATVRPLTRNRRDTACWRSPGSHVHLCVFPQVCPCTGTQTNGLGQELPWSHDVVWEFNAQRLSPLASWRNMDLYWLAGICQPRNTGEHGFCLNYLTCLCEWVEKLFYYCDLHTWFKVDSYIFLHFSQGFARTRCPFSTHTHV